MSPTVGEQKMKRIYPWEPWFFIFFGLFHIHRIWALVDRASYALFWTGIMENKGSAYFLAMAVLAGLCILGIGTFLHERKANYLWRWIYLLGGAYVLFDLFAIAAGLAFWKKLLAAMFDVASPYWNAIWIFFVLLGTAVFILGICRMRKRCREKNA